jgi:hypothetical protein
VVLGSGVAAIGLIAPAILASNWTGPNAALVLAAPLLVAGRGCGLVISANQTLTLRSVTRDAGVAAGVLISAHPKSISGSRTYRPPATRSVT